MTDHAELFIDCRNDLGEGPFWHPSRGELFWFDINVGNLHRASATGEILDTWNFGEPVAAAALVSKDVILVASASAIVEFNIATGARRKLHDLEASNPATRSNDSRVSPLGDWWIGTMGRQGGKDLGSVYHFRNGRFTTLKSPVTIPNSICFAPGGKIAYFADSPTRKILKAPIDPATGLPSAPWEVFVDLTGQSAVPDGSVVDSQGFLWNAEYGGSRVVRYAPDGTVDRVVRLDASCVTCPAFGGPDLKTLYITTARQRLTADDLVTQPGAGGIFRLETDVAGQAEAPVSL